MNWFQSLCRNMGLMVHNIRNPDGAEVQKTVTQKSVEEKKINETTTLRRTVIEEVEIKKQH